MDFVLWIRAYPVDWIKSSGPRIPWIGSTIQTFVDLILTMYCRLTKSDFTEPVNIGSDEMVSMNEMAEIVLSFENKGLFSSVVMNVSTRKAKVAIRSIAANEEH